MKPCGPERRDMRNVILRHGFTFLHTLLRRLFGCVSTRRHCAFLMFAHNRRTHRSAPKKTPFQSKRSGDGTFFLETRCVVCAIQSTKGQAMSTTATLGPHLPYLRRYARALTGSQSSGDAYVRASLEAILAGNAELMAGVPPRIALYRLFHLLLSSTARDLPAAGGVDAPSFAEQRVQSLRPGDREAILLTSVEGFSVPEVATILDRPISDVESAIASASRAIDRELSSRVMIIEDEMIIALDLENLVADLGHTVIGIATTREEAVRLARKEHPELVLADIQLADGSSGVDAAHEILDNASIPIIFITAFPECLLTGERPEPTYLVQKPFSRDTLRATIAQALFFNKPVYVTSTTGRAPSAKADMASHLK
jgi:DNA-directed RNA polymerase specialized sigma24 family protein